MPNTYYKILPIILVLPLLLAATACFRPDTQLGEIRNRGELRVVTTLSPTTYYIDADSETGFEYELVRLFAEQLKVKLRVITASNKADMIAILKRGGADIAVGLIKRTFAEDQDLVSGPEYYSVNQQVIYKNGFDRPKTPNDLDPFQLHIAEGLVRPETLMKLKEEHPEFNWKFHNDLNSGHLIEQVQNDQIAYAAVYSNELTLAQQTYPELRASFSISEPSPLIWLSMKSADTTLLDEIQTFFKTTNESAFLAELIEYFYGPVKKFDYVDQKRFVERFSTRLPKYMALFKHAAEQYRFDWRLLAAMSYQESHWNARARSPTGVRGLMMLTLDTAKQFNVSSRLDPEQSIMGGTEYIRQLVNSIPERIQEPDRIWFALAAYNIGSGHMEDARIITQKRGGNPDKWQDVRNALPLLRQEKWYKGTLFGYARGNEAVTYVENIRKYYNTMVQLTQEDILLPSVPDKIIPIEGLAL